MVDEKERSFQEKFYAKPSDGIGGDYCDPDLQRIWDSLEAYFIARQEVLKCGLQKIEMAAATERMSRAWQQTVFAFDRLDERLCPEKAPLVSEAIMRLATQRKVP